MEFLPCAQGNIGKKGNSYIFYYVYKTKFFGQISHCLNSSVSRATVLGLKITRFESWLRGIFFYNFYNFFTWKSVTICIPWFLICEKCLFYMKML